MDQGDQKEIIINRKTTSVWSLAVIITIVIQTSGIIWWASGLNSTVAQHTLEIKALQSEVPPLSRQTVEDLLLVRDTRIDNIEESVDSIEEKIDRAFGYTE